MIIFIIINCKCLKNQFIIKCQTNNYEGDPFDNEEEQINILDDIGNIVQQVLKLIFMQILYSYLLTLFTYWFNNFYIILIFLLILQIINFNTHSYIIETGFRITTLRWFNLMGT